MPDQCAAPQHGARDPVAHRAPQRRGECAPDPRRGRRRRRCGPRDAVGRFWLDGHPRTHHGRRPLTVDRTGPPWPQRGGNDPARRVTFRAQMTELEAKGVSVLLVDDHPIVRQGYRRVLESQGGLHVVAEADNAAEAYVAFKAHDPDVVVMDISEISITTTSGSCALKAP